MRNLSGRKEFFKHLKRAVVKVGTSLLADPVTGLNKRLIRSLANNIADFDRQGIKVALVTSGAIGAGMHKLGLKERPKTIPGKQAAAAIGQNLLIAAYAKEFNAAGRAVGQMLLTRDDFHNLQRSINARHTINALFNAGAVPIINENDTIAVDEIKLGDNDNLSSLVATLIRADLLVILSDVNGLYTGDPMTDKNANQIYEVGNGTKLFRISGRTGCIASTGGMLTKVEAARQAAASGIMVIIANGHEKNILQRIFDGEKTGTFFHPAKKNLKTFNELIRQKQGLKG